MSVHKVRIVKTSSAFAHLHPKVWKRSELTIDSKRGIYKAVRTTLYYRETWTTLHSHAKIKINVTELVRELICQASILSCVKLSYGEMDI